MPLNDVSELLLDPDFAESVVVVRRSVSIGDNGREVVTQKRLHLTAVVIPGGIKDIRRHSDYESSGQAISVFIRGFDFQGTDDGHLPDLVLWKESHYVVMKKVDFSHFGAGFTIAECAYQKDKGQP